ncbi:MAG: DNA mismatch repair protein MutL [Alphaproteobacteria bacterium MarineAlpha9_Bin4]|nr:hypothetical protein [Pelagibacterales bacterium]PPR26644.1 MAG: DNA mismatch repair protein MutL [Alphaproteobacteria bacterium MarineAlpha9_Bin4]|tara:strand:- start:129 stop:1874 length:1746 start_codon:yes stop_codon:yes gene_type:complete
MNKIRLLPDYIIDTIAAGEVIERPYSIIKELLENSIDAKAENIDIHVEGGGENKIVIIDDGKGIDENDLNLCVKRHATSKISNNDLSKISTLGFRGEALYAIASVSKLEITSKTSLMSNAFKLLVEENKVLDKKPSKGKNGTSISVENLFKNFPVRKKFLSNKKTENYYIRETIKSIAISHPRISFNYFEDNKLKFVFASKKTISGLKNRVLEIMGQDFYESSLFIEVKKNYCNIKGYISIPTYNKSNWKDTVIVVNNRVIKDRNILGVIKAAYAGLLAGNRFPVLVLDIKIPYEDIDANVHPRKTEISLLERKKINSTLIKVIRETLEKAGLINSGIYEKKLLNTFYTDNKKDNVTKQIIFPNNIKYKFDNEVQSKDIASNNTINDYKDFRLGFAIAQINSMFIISQTKDKVILIDQHAAHERIVLEKLKSSFFNNNIQRQILLMPEIIDIDSDIKLFLDNKKKIGELGIIFDGYGQNSIIVRELPSILGKIKVKELFDDLYLQLEKFDEVNLNSYQIENLLSSIACHNSIRAGRKLNIEEMNNLLRLMEETPNSGQCNHGRPTFVELSIKDIEKLFGRI